MSVKKELVVVTGGAGFIGSHLTERLVSLGYRVRVLDNLSQGRREWVAAGAEWVHGDILDLSVCRETVKDAKAVFHMAAMSKAGPSIDLIEFCTQQNVIGTQNILVASREAGVKKVIYSASSTYYGNTPGIQSEDALPDCLNPYALSKYVGEQYCHLFTKLYGLPTICLRYFNVYGKRLPRTGAYALVLGAFLERAQAGKPLEIHGDGSQRRDFVHVDDVVDANLAAFQTSAQGISLNIGSGTNTSIQELANMISDQQMYSERRKGDADSTLADLTQVRQVLDWSPKRSLESEVRKLIQEVRQA